MSPFKSGWFFSSSVQKRGKSGETQTYLGCDSEIFLVAASSVVFVRGNLGTPFTPSYEVGRFRQTFAGHIYSKLRFAPLFLDWMSKYMFISGLESLLNLRFAHPGFAIKTFWIGHLSQVSPALCIY